jgi:hypothetical protein
MLEHADVAVIGMGPGGENVAGWAPVAARIDAEATDNWNDKVAVDRFEGKGGRFIRRLAGPGRVDVGDGSSRPPEPSCWPPAPRSRSRPSPALPTFPTGPIGTRNLAEATV